MRQDHNNSENSPAAGNSRPPAGRGELVLLCGREDFRSEVRRELQKRRMELRIADADGIAAARRILGEQLPAVILAEERALAETDGPGNMRRRVIESALSLLAVSAPVVWVGAAEEGPAMTQAVGSGAVDFVPRSALCLPAAVTMVERRLRSRTGSVSANVARGGSVLLGGMRLDDRDFGEVLRHELNNPLTGILGNAELLLLEVHRGKLDLPMQTLQRLETITELAVRMRETVRQLSDRWEGAGENSSGGNEKMVGQPPRPVRG